MCNDILLLRQPKLVTVTYTVRQDGEDKVGKRNTQRNEGKMVEGEGFEPSKAEPSDLQSDPFGHSGTPPQLRPP